MNQEAGKGILAASGDDGLLTAHRGIPTPVFVNLRQTRFGGAPVADPARTSDSGPAPGRRPALLRSGFAEYIPVFGR